MKSSLCINTDDELDQTNYSLLTLQSSWLHGILVRLAALLRLWKQFDEVVDTEDGDGGLGGKFKALRFDHGGLVHASLTVISRLAIQQVQTNPVRQPKYSNTGCSGLHSKVTMPLKQTEHLNFSKSSRFIWLQVNTQCLLLLHLCYIFMISSVF